MSSIPSDLKYTKSHEWIRKGSNPRQVVIGITDFAQCSLGDVTFIQLPPVGRELKIDEVFGTVESVKAVSELYAPLSGKVLRVNEALNSDPAPLNSDPYGAGWVLELEMSDEGEWQKLLNAQAYASVAV